MVATLGVNLCSACVPSSIIWWRHKSIHSFKIVLEKWTDKTNFGVNTDFLFRRLTWPVQIAANNRATSQYGTVPEVTSVNGEQTRNLFSLYTVRDYFFKWTTVLFAWNTCEFFLLINF